MRRRGRIVVCAMLVLTACAAPADVEVEQSFESSGALVPDGQAGFPDATPGDAGPDDPAGVPLPASPLEWTDCAVFDIPERIVEQSPSWECTTVSVDMDPYGSTAGLPDVELALTRHRATGLRRGSILLNPGGPGAAGLRTAWGVRSAMPTELLRGFDILAWDPRGIGASIPSISCGDAASGDDDFIERCAEETGELASFVSAPYSAADMEAIRIALGEDELNYLGYSYGTILGAIYASRFPDTVGGFVLDGVTDPQAGSSSGPFEDGFAVYADDGFDAATARLVELCDATDRCLADRSAADVMAGLPFTVDQFPTDDFAGLPESVDSAAFDELIETSVTYAGDWELLATSLGDADDGDASALAALIAIDAEQNADVGAGSDSSGGLSSFAQANFLIYCADFAPVITQWSFCDAVPGNEERLSEIVEIDVDRPVLVIGTEYDPLTPGHHAPEFADALGDATHMIWEGVGHTAFPGWTSCIDAAVADQFLGRSLPDDGTRCTMLDGIDDDTELADELFGFESIEARNWIFDALESRGSSSTVADCISTTVIAGDDVIDDRVVTHIILDVTSTEATASLDDAMALC